MNRASKFLKSSAVYFVGNVLTGLISFFLLPLYTAKVPTEEMGYYNVSINYLNILIPVVCLVIWSAIMRFMFDYDKPEDRYQAVFNGLYIFARSVAVYTAIFVVLQFAAHIRYLWLIYLYGLFTMLQYVYAYSARGLGYNTAYAVSGLVGSVVNCVSNIVMILVLHMSLSSLYIAMTLGLAAQVVIMESRVRLLHRIKGFRPDMQVIKSMVSFSVPLALNSASFWFLSGYNSVAISHTLGLEANGLYAVAAKFTTALSLVSTCFTLAWQEMVFSMGNEKEDKSAFYTKASNYYIMFLFAGLLALVPLVKLIFPIMVGSSYSGSFMLVPLYLFATVASIYSFFLDNVFSAEKNTRVVLYATLIAAAVNVAVFHLLVWHIGPQAANISLLSGFLMNIGIRMVILRKSVTIKLNYWIILGGTALFAAVFYVYANMGMAANAVCFGVVCVIAIFALRDILMKLWAAAKRGMSTGKSESADV